MTLEKLFKSTSVRDELDASALLALLNTITYFAA